MWEAKVWLLLVAPPSRANEYSCVDRSSLCNTRMSVQIDSFVSGAPRSWAVHNLLNGTWIHWMLTQCLVSNTGGCFQGIVEWHSTSGIKLHILSSWHQCFFKLPDFSNPMHIFFSYADSGFLMLRVASYFFDVCLPVMLAWLTPEPTPAMRPTLLNLSSGSDNVGYQQTVGFMSLSGQ